MLSIQPLALPSARQVLKPAHRYQRSGLALLPVRARKQSKKQDVGQDADLASDVLPADLQKLSKLAKDELQHQLEVRGLDMNGNKEELANRLLDNLIAQESALSTNPPERVKLQQQLEQSTAAPARRGRRTSRKATASADPQPEIPVIPGSPLSADTVIAAAAAVTAEPIEAPAAARRGRKTSRKATSSADPLPSPADIVAAAVTEDVIAEMKPTRRGRKTSRKATTSADPLPTPADIVAAAETTGAEVKPTRRGRKTSRKATTSADPLEVSTVDPAAAAEAAAAVESATEAVTGISKRGRRSKTTAAEPSPAAATEDSAPVKASRGRRTSRKSSVLEPETTDAAPTAAAVEAPARRGRRTSSAKAASPAEDTTTAAAASTPAEAPAGTPTVSRAKLLAQQLAKKEIATHGTGAAAAAAAAATAATAAAGDAATAEPAAAAPGSAWVGADELLYAGSQAQSDNLLIGGDNSMQAVGAQSTFSIDNGSVDEVIAQLTAERGMADEPQLRPEANLSPFDSMMPPSAGAADAAASWSAAAAPAAAGVDTDGQHPSMTDCVAAVEEPLTSSAEAVEVDEAPDTAMAAFDHMYVHIASPAAAEADLQHPNMSDCVAAVEEPLLTKADAVVLDEAPDAAMAAFDHTSLDSATAAAVAGGNQTPNLQDIVLAIESSSLPASLDESLGEDEEPDVALAAFDRMVPEAAAAATAATAATAAVMKSADEGYDQAYLDPLQPSALGATVGSGSVDLADAETEVVLPAAATTATPAAVTEVKTTAAAAPVTEKQPQQEKQGGQESADFSVMVQRWWASVMQMFEDWQKNLSGPK